MRCHYCGSKSEFLAEVEGVRFNQCSGCRSIFATNPNVNPAVYDADYFEKFKTFAESGVSSPLCMIRTAAIRRFLTGKPDGVLDIGCGSGDFLDCFRSQAGTERAYGIEINQVAREYAGERFPGVRVFESALDLVSMGDGAGFDVLTAFDVIEHFQDPNMFLVNHRPLLNDGGVFMVSTPFVPEREITAEQFAAWRHCRPLEHFSHPTLAGLQNIFPDFGLEIVWHGFPEDSVRRPDAAAIGDHNILSVIGRACK